MGLRCSAIPANIFVGVLGFARVEAVSLSVTKGTPPPPLPDALYTRVLLRSPLMKTRTAVKVVSRIADPHLLFETEWLCPFIRGVSEARAARRSPSR